MRRREKIEPPPAFDSEAQERRFWETHDTTDHVDWDRARIAVFPDLKPSTETISLRLPAGLLAELKILANKRDVPYQSLMKVFLAERVAREREPGAAPRLGNRAKAREASSLTRSTDARSRKARADSGSSRRT
jgi:predicted DNA binding CopG/RHH family protein